MKKDKKVVLVTGGYGMVGMAMQKIVREEKEKYKGYQFKFCSRMDGDLANENDAWELFADYLPDIVIHLAAKVGGIKANSTKMANFFMENLKINANVLQCSHDWKVEKLVSMLSTCIYPDKVEYPLTEEQIHNGKPHASNFGYAHAKRMLDIGSQSYRLQYGDNFITVVANNIFGEYDNFNENDSHVIPALILKIVNAKMSNKEKIECWGTGTPLREFTYSGDIAKAVLIAMEKYDGTEPINIGNTNEFSIKEVTEKICDIVRYDKERVFWDESKPNGQMKKNSSNERFLLTCGNELCYSNFDDMLRKTVEWYIENIPTVRR